VAKDLLVAEFHQSVGGLLSNNLQLTQRARNISHNFAGGGGGDAGSGSGSSGGGSGSSGSGNSGSSSKR
jgi:hypothetical protein